MNFGKIGQILLTVLCLYVISAICSFVQGYLMTGVSQKTTYRLRREISEKINRMPMSYFDTKPVGEVLSRVTNDVDTLGQSLITPRHRKRFRRRRCKLKLITYYT